MNACDFIILRGGLCIPRPALEIALDLEARGIRLQADGDELLVPKGVLTVDERQVLRRWKQHVIALLNYETSDSHLLDRTVQ